MVFLSSIDGLIILLFFTAVIIIGFIPKKSKNNEAENFLLSNRKVGLLLFIFTNVATWYGGILGVGEFTYKYGLMSWFTQGLPYYIFALLFALFFAEKIRGTSLFTIPEKFEKVYGKRTSLISSILIFVLVSPASYLLMVGYLFSLIFDINIFWGLVITGITTAAYMMKGGFKSDVYTDVFEFFIMFGGFIVIVITAYFQFGGFGFLETNLPAGHLTLTGGASPFYLLVWFLIALWTFTDPGFHQRTNAAVDGKTAKWGIIISIGFWALFDFLTTSTGLYSKALLPNLANPVLSFPMLAEKILAPGLKGLFYAAMFATVLSTLNSFVFLSATTVGYDIIYKLQKVKDEKKIIRFTQLGIIITTILGIVLAYFFKSVIEIWFTIGSICIPGLILLVVGAYYDKLKIPGKWAVIEIIASSGTALLWFILRPGFEGTMLFELEPMIAGLAVAVVVHAAGVVKRETTDEKRETKDEKRKT
jgi:SSS family solute:Na+ symporter